MPRQPGTALLALAFGVSLASCRKPDAPPSRFVISVPYEVETLDPHAFNRLADFAILSHFYEPLVVTDASLSLKPALAERWENPDLATWVFHVRKGVAFHDGRPLTAQDVAFSVERLLREKDLEMSGYVTAIASVRALGPLKVEIKTRTPLAILLNKLRFVLVVPQGSDAASLRATVVGTGPYRLVRFGKDEVVMTRNEAHWGGPPFLRDVTFRVGRGPAAALDDLLSGRSAFVQTSSKASLQALSGRPGVTIRKRTSISVKYLAFDVGREVSPWVRTPRNPFRDPRVRRAIDLAIDRRVLAERLPAPALPASQPVPPTIFGYNAAIKVPRADRAEARRLLGEAGYPEGFALTLHARSLFSEAARIVASMLAEVGIRADVVSLPDPEFFATAGRGGGALVLSRYGCPTGDASDILDNMVHSADTAKGYGRSSDTGYRSQEVDRLIEESAEVLDMARRRRLLHEIMARITADVVWVPLYVDEDVYALRDGVSWTPRNDNFVIASEIGPPR